MSQIITIRPDSKMCKCKHDIKDKTELHLFYSLQPFDIFGQTKHFAQCDTCNGFYIESPDNRRDFVSGGNIFIDKNFYLK